MYKKLLVLRSKLHSGNSALIKAGIASLDQIILSAINFLISFVLIKFVNQEQYGFYAIVFPLTLFFTAVQNAIVTTPLAVLYYNKLKDNRSKYVSGLYSGLLVFIMFTLISIIFIGTGIIFITNTTELTLALISVAIASSGILIREFIRSFHFTQENPTKALVVDIIYAFAFIILFALMIISNSVDVYLALIIMGSASLIGGSRYFILQKDKIEKAIIAVSFKENWIYGRWALIGVIFTHIQSYSYVYLIGIFLGSQEAAIVAAARFLLTPLALFQAGWMKVAIPRGSRLFEQGHLDKFIKELSRSFLIYSIVMIFYSVLLLLFSDTVLRTILDERYVKSLDYIWYWTIISVIGFASNNSSFGLQVLKKFRLLTIVNTFTLIITLVSCFILLPLYQVKGALISLIIGGIAYMTPLWYYLLKYKNIEISSNEQTTN